MIVQAKKKKRRKKKSQTLTECFHQIQQNAQFIGSVQEWQEEIRMLVQFTKMPFLIVPFACGINLFEPAHENMVLIT